MNERLQCVVNIPYLSLGGTKEHVQLLKDGHATEFHWNIRVVSHCRHDLRLEIASPGGDLSQPWGMVPVGAKGAAEWHGQSPADSSGWLGRPPLVLSPSKLSWFHPPCWHAGLSCRDTPSRHG